MLDKTKERRTKTCTGCSQPFVVSQKKALDKARYCTHRCFLQSRKPQDMADLARSRAKHGLYKSRIYRIWGAMKQRCLNPNAPAYARYGAAGISIDDKWMSFEGFYEDMGGSYREGLTIDRIDGTKGYSKKNCRWATQKEQTHNTKRNVFVDCEGEIVCASECARRLGVHTTTILGRIYSGKLKQVWKEKTT